MKPEHLFNKLRENYYIVGTSLNNGISHFINYLEHKNYLKTAPTVTEFKTVSGKKGRYEKGFERKPTLTEERKYRENILKVAKTLVKNSCDFYESEAKKSEKIPENKVILDKKVPVALQIDYNYNNKGNTVKKKLIIYAKIKPKDFLFKQKIGDSENDFDIVLNTDKYLITQGIHTELEHVPSEYFTPKTGEFSLREFLETKYINPRKSRVIGSPYRITIKTPLIGESQVSARFNSNFEAIEKKYHNSFIAQRNLSEFEKKDTTQTSLNYFHAS